MVMFMVQAMVSPPATVALLLVVFRMLVGVVVMGQGEARVQRVEVVEEMVAVAPGMVFCAIFAFSL